MIRTNHVKKEFDHTVAIRDVNIHIQKGSIYGLLGSNGAGKTTLLKCIAGIYKQDQGDILVDKEPIFENTTMKNRMIFLPDSLYFFPQSTVKQLSRFFKRLYSSWNEERFQRLQSAFLSRLRLFAGIPIELL